MHAQHGGTGIGLAIVKELVQAHGGQVAITNTPGSGTTVSLTLPVAPTRPASGTSADVVPAPSAAGAD